MSGCSLGRVRVIHGSGTAGYVLVCGMFLFIWGLIVFLFVLLVIDFRASLLLS